ncbi:hypothetical protein ACLKMH_16670 [Psychromonas sp. KJ10-10]|uniref:hypothetical protein n=1 Tax=Psychromonas sp. KJ10-10 TaxID=3391823 RepID=UPI0039B51F90
MLESKAKALGYQPLGYLKDYAYAGLGPDRMGLGPVYATSKLLDKASMQITDFDLIELNEAFAYPSTCQPMRLFVRSVCTNLPE